MKLPWPFANLITKSHTTISEIATPPYERIASPQDIDLAASVRAALSRTAFITDWHSYAYYESSAHLAIVVDKIAKAVGQIKPTIWDNDLNQFDDDFPVIDLLLSPGFGQSYTQSARDRAISMLLSNNLYTLLTGNINAEPFAISSAKPFWVDIEEARDGYAGKYRVSRFGQMGNQRIYSRIEPTEFRFVTDDDLSELIHTKGQTNRTTLKGQNPISALLYSLIQSIQGDSHNAGLLANSASPSGILTTPADSPTGGNLSSEQFERLKAQIDDQYTGSINAGRPMLLEGGLKWEQLGMSNKDMDYVKLMEANADRIALRYDVPLAMVNKGTMTFNNFETAIRTFHDDAVLPLVDIIFEGLQHVLFPRFDMDEKRFGLVADPAGVQAEYLRSVDRAKDMKALESFTPNELRSELGREALDGGDELLVSTNTMPIASDAFTDDQVTEEERDEALDDEKQFKANAKKAGLSDAAVRQLWRRR